jgi:hypothetical protein
VYQETKKKDYFSLAAYNSDNLQAQMLEAVVNVSTENEWHHSIKI